GRDPGDDLVGDRLDALEVVREREVEAVEVGLVLDQREARERVEVLDAAVDHAAVERLEQRQELLDARRDTGLADREEEIEEHRPTRASPRGAPSGGRARCPSRLSGARPPRRYPASHAPPPPRSC